MGNNNQTNRFIRWCVVFIDFLLLNALLLFFHNHHVVVDKWPEEKWNVFLLGCNLAMLLAQWQFATIVHRRWVTASDILQRTISLSLAQVFLSYAILKILTSYPIARIMVVFGPMLLFLLLVSRVFERLFIKYLRKMGRNTRTAVFVGADSELDSLYRRLAGDLAIGFHCLGYYANEEMSGQMEHLGTLDHLLANLNQPDAIVCGDEMYVCLSRREREKVRLLSRFCDQHLIRFYYVPVSVETLGLNLKREMLEDMELYTTYENPLANPLNRFLKRLFDILFAAVVLLILLPFFPIIALIIKVQSPGPIFFKQLRTGLDGRSFYCYKFRSMHVNADADRVQATKDDPRKYAFGNFMRKANIDELPQFWNVLKGDMSVVGPRPHMLAHTEQYSQLIAKYMVRHFVKPGVTGWAQVTGYRGETKELWQMEGRVQHDIWYIEHWSIWLDLRIIWLTVKNTLVHDEQAY